MTKLIMTKLIIPVVCFFIVFPVVAEAQTSRSRSANTSYVTQTRVSPSQFEEIAFYTLDKGGNEFIRLSPPNSVRHPAPSSSSITQVSYVTSEPASAVPQEGEPSSILDAEETQFIAELNQLRASLGLPPVIVVEQIVRDCRNWSAYLQRTGRFYHGSNQENIAMGHESGSATFQQWRRSPGHNAKLSNRNDMVAGIGRAGNVWTYRAAPSLDAYQSGKMPH